MSNEEILIRLGSALILGMIIGLERIIRGHEAGVRTHGLVSMGAALFITTSIAGAQALGADVSQVLRVFSQIVSGIGFLGAGLIFMSEKENKKKGLTSAATLWATSAIGAACGFGLYGMAGIATVLILVTLTFVSTAEWGVVKLFRKGKK
jgi:putative Mg2+ transporter-C (MgtC) family protein